jgi:transposase-like protein
MLCCFPDNPSGEGIVMSRRDLSGHSKEQFWRELLGQWQRSELTIRAFCAQHGVSEPSFYAWRRTLAHRDQQARRPTATRHTQRLAAAPSAPTFVPVQVVATPAVSTTIEVVLGNGRSIRLAPGFEPATLRQLLAILESPAC